ncbi:MAG: GNAT family N-acetyltransferase [Cyanobacteria bacterium J06560_2]
MADSLTIKAATLQDEPTLWTMLMHAAHETSLSAVKSNPELVRYVSGWGRSGDLGVIAEKRETAVGAAWLRIWPEDSRGYGFVANEVPELAIAVISEMRGQGVGTDLLSQIIQAATSQFPAISLSIRSDNPALRLYKRFGFVAVTGSEVINREGGRSFNMIRCLES